MDLRELDEGAEDFLRLCKWYVFSCARSDHRRNAMMAGNLCGGGAEDLFHEVFLKLWERLGRKEIKAKLSTATIKQIQWVTNRVLASYPPDRKPESLPEEMEDPESERSLFDQMEQRELEGVVSEIILTLPDREREILKMRFGLEDGFQCDLRKTGKAFGVTSERIRQIECKALNKLRHHRVTDRLIPFTSCRELR